MAQTIQDFLASRDAGTQQVNMQPINQPAPQQTQPRQNVDMRGALAPTQQNIARDREQIAQRRERYRAAVMADLDSVKYSKSAYQALKDSGTGLAQMSDDELNFIADRYAKSDIGSRKAYTNSLSDQYLASVGLPASKELSKYRTAWFDYNKDGGIVDRYGDMTGEEFEFIAKKFGEDTIVGFDGNLYDKNGKNQVKYTDTLLDDQLKSLGLPSATQMEVYHAAYLQDKEKKQTFVDLTQKFYDDVFQERDKGTDLDTAWTIVRNKPEYAGLKDYFIEPAELPNEDDEAYSGSNGKTKFDTDTLKAIEQNYAYGNAEMRVSKDDYTKYETSLYNKFANEVERQRKQKVYDAAQSALVKAATTDAERKEQRHALQEFVSTFKPEDEHGNRIKASDWDGYLQLLNAGVPSDVINASQVGGAAVLEKWNDETNGTDTAKWAEYDLLFDGVTRNDPQYGTMKDAKMQTHVAKQMKNFGGMSAYDPLLYEKQVKSVGSRRKVVSAYGALYNAVNGKEYSPVSGGTQYENQVLSTMTEHTDADKPLVDYLTGDERGTFNMLFSESPYRAMRYLNSLEPLLDKRASRSDVASLVTARNEQDAEDIAYSMNIRNLDRQIDSLKEGRTDYWKKEAWDKYRDYSDDALERILAKDYNTSSEVIRNGAFYNGSSSMQAGEARDIMYVIETRQNAKDNAKLAASLYGYTDEEGAKATESVKESIGQQNNMTKFVNGFEYEDKPTNHADISTIDMSIDLSNFNRNELEEEYYTPLTAQMTDEQKNQYNWLLVNKGEQEAAAYFNSIKRGLDIKSSSSVMAQARSEAADDPFGTFVGSMAWMPYNGLMSMTGGLLNDLLGLDTTETQAMQWDVGGVASEAIGMNLADSVASAFDNDGIGSVANYLYGVAKSSADSAVGAGLSKAAPLVGELALSGSAYASTLRHALNKGVSSDDAAKMAAASGIIEFATEHIGIDHIFNAIEKAKGKAIEQGMPYFLNLLAEAGINFGSEALEEGVGGVFETAADMLINGDSSELLEYYNNAIANGRSPEEATRLAATKFATDVGLEALAGGLAGSGSVVVAGTVPGVAMAANNGLVRYAQGDDARAIMGHSNSFAAGRSVIDDLYGSVVGDAVQKYLDTSETVGDKKRINDIVGALSGVSNTSMLYGVIFDSEGNMKLDRDQQVALASLLAIDGAQADSASIEYTYIKEQALQQGDAQRKANSADGKVTEAVKNIKTAQEVRTLNSNIEGNKAGILKAREAYNTKLNGVLSHINRLAQQKVALTKKMGANVGNPKAQEVILNSLKAIQDEYDRVLAQKNEIESVDSITLENDVRQLQDQININQGIIDKHYASSYLFLNSATSNRGVYEGELKAAQAKIASLGNTIDSMMESEFTDANDDAWLDAVQQRLADAQNEADYWSKKLRASSPTSLANAVAALDSGTAQDYIAQMNNSTEPVAVPAASSETVSEAQNSGSSSNTENSTNEAQNAEESAAEDVKQETKKEEPKKTKRKTFNISKTVQGKINRIASKLGIDVVWQTRDEIGGNGKYDPQHPNKIYLATDMIADANLNKETVVAREFFTHEIVHYVANTKTYRRLASLAERYYKQLNADKGVDGADYYQFLIDRIIDKEKKLHDRDFTVEQAREEITAMFTQEVLFSGESGNKNALNWLADANSGTVKNLLHYIEYLIKRGQVRRMKDGGAIKALLLDSERALTVALQERKVLDEKGLKSAFSDERRTDTTQTADAEAPAAEGQTETVAETEEPEGNPNVSGEAATLSGTNVETTDVAEAIDESAVAVNEDGEPTMNVINNGNAAMMSLGTYENGGREALEEYLKKRSSGENPALTKSQAAEIMAKMDEIYAFSKEYADKYVSFGNWSYAQVKKAPNGLPALSVVTPNNEYNMNIDFSLVCVKRRALNAVINELVRRGKMETMDFSGETIARINEIIRSEGYETACLMCFVETTRYRQASFADSFVEKYNNLVNSLGGEADYHNFGGNETLQARAGIHELPDADLDWTEVDKVLDNYMARKGLKSLPAYNPNKSLRGGTTEEAIAFELKMNPSSRKLMLRGDLMSTNGFDSLVQRAPNILRLWNKKGVGGPKNTFSDMQYLNDIAKGDWNADKAYDVGGVRVQSFSDYVPTMFFDYVQMVADLAAGRMPAHAYTKELNFVKLFGMTGIKINMSLVPEVGDSDIVGMNYVRDAEGNIMRDESGEPLRTYAWAKESFGYDRKKGDLDYDLINRIQGDENYGKNCGSIAIGISDEHIMRMLRDPQIKMVIPYHRSNLAAILAEMMNIDRFVNYEDTQHTRKWNGKRWENLSSKEEYEFNKHLHEDGDPKKTVQGYLDWCAENHYAPKFEETDTSTKFKNEEGYYKLLEDFTLYDNNGNYTPQGAVQMRFAQDGEATIFTHRGQPIQGGVSELLQYSLEDPRQTMIEQGASDLVDKIVDTMEGRNVGDEMYSDGSTVEDLVETNEDFRRMFSNRGKGYETDADDVRYMELAEKYRDGSATDEETAELRNMVEGRAEALRAEVFAATDVPAYRIRRDAPPKKTIKVYKTFTLTEDGQPSALFVSSRNPLPVGVWLDAQDTYHFQDQKNGRWYVPSTKNPNTKGGATGRPTLLKNLSAETLSDLERLEYITKDNSGKVRYDINSSSASMQDRNYLKQLGLIDDGGVKYEVNNDALKDIDDDLIPVMEELADDGLIGRTKKGGQTKYSLSKKKVESLSEEDVQRLMNAGLVTEKGLKLEVKNGVGTIRKGNSVVGTLDADTVNNLVDRGLISKQVGGEYTAASLTSLAYRPGWHAGDLPFFPQGGMQISGSNYKNVHRYNQVVFECEMAADEDYTTYDINDDGSVTYRDRQEMPTNGSYKFATNPMVRASDIGAWYISGSLKIGRALTEEEANRILESEGRLPQEWQAYQDEAEYNALKGDSAKAAYEKRIGSLDLDRLGYDPNRTAERMKLPDLVTYDDNGDIIPLSQRFNSEVNDVRYSDGETIDDLIAEYGLKQRSRRGEENNIRTPERTTKTTRVSDVAQTLKERQDASKAARDNIDNIIVETLNESAVPTLSVGSDAGLVYKPVTMEQMNQWADDYITKAGSLDQAMRDLARDIPIAKLTELSRLEAAAMRVFAEIAQTDDFDVQAYREFVAAIGMMNSQWGRMGAAMRILNNSPLGRVEYMKKVVERINEENAKAMSKGVDKLLHPKGVKPIEIPAHLYKALEQARTPEEVRKAEFDISQSIGEQSPLSFADAMRNWRYFSMLFNPVTHARNILGNVSMLVMRTAKDAVAAGLEHIATRTGLMKPEERTHNLKLKAPKNVHDFAVDLYLKNKDAVQGNDRYGVKDKMRDAVKKSPIKPFDWLMRANGNALEAEDAMFLRATYTAAAQQYIMAHGIDVDNITPKQTAEINAYATKQAQEATYRDASALADTLNALSKQNAAWRFAIEAVMPFKKTPINVAKRGIEYSPAGLIKGVFDLARFAQQKGKNASGDFTISASKVADELGKGLVGSALTLVGMWLAKAGILKLKAGDDDKAETFGKDTGHQDYSLEIGDLSIKIESVAPMTFPLFAGAAILDAFGEDGVSFDKGFAAIADSILSVADPLMDMSFMSSLNSALNSYSQNKIFGVVENAATSYINQYFPTLIGRLNTITTPTRRTTKSAQSAKEGIGTQRDYMLRSIATKVPGLNRVLEPYVTVTGEYDTKTSFGDYALAVMNNLLSPVNVSVIDKDEATREISRLIGETGETSFVPRNPNKYFTQGGVTYNLTADEYTEYAKDHNETVFAALTSTINSDEYQRATDDERAEMLENTYDAAHRTAQKKWKAIIIQQRDSKNE